MSESDPSPPIRVLIVEDDPMMQLGLEQALSNYDTLEVIGRADDGYLAVEEALKLKPNVIVMDIGLPRQDGIAATQKIKETQAIVNVMFSNLKLKNLQLTF
jgi:DNA-binding NarL/FixJ family response regulator